MQTIDPTADPPESQPPPFQIHGVLVRVSNTGVLILGESGTGKSECAFALIRKGHQLVADDVVEVFVKDGHLCGRPTDFTRGLMEVRGMGIVDAGAMFGEEVLCSESSIDLCVELNESAAVDRFGAVKHEHVLGQFRLPKFVFPMRVSGGLASLVEKAAAEYRSNAQPSGQAANQEEHSRASQ